MISYACSVTKVAWLVSRQKAQQSTHMKIIGKDTASLNHCIKAIISTKTFCPYFVLVIKSTPLSQVHCCLFQSQQCQLVSPFIYCGVDWIADARCLHIWRHKSSKHPRFSHLYLMTEQNIVKIVHGIKNLFQNNKSGIV